jgi:hypothetical protein
LASWPPSLMASSPPSDPFSAINNYDLIRFVYSIKTKA